MNPVREPCAGKRERNRLERRQLFIDIATRAFLDRGYAATTMSAIVREAGGSKTTLWGYFCSKEALFEAVVDAQVASLEKRIHDGFIFDGVSRSTLLRFLLCIAEILLSEDAIKLFRLVLAEGERFPFLRAVFYERGPATMRIRTRDYLGSRFDPAEADHLAQLVVTALVGFRTDALLRASLPSPEAAEAYFENFLTHLRVPPPGFSPED